MIDSPSVMLAQDHMGQQVRDTAKVQAVVGGAFNRFVDPNDVEGSFARFLRYAVALVVAQRRQGELTAAQYFTAAKALAGHDSAIPPLATPAANLALVAQSLIESGPVAYREAVDAGNPESTAFATARDLTLGNAKKLILNGPRDTVMDLSRRDTLAEGWARVSDGDPCYFCAMLVSRGPVYTSRSTGSFTSHYKCGCNVRAFFKGDNDGGWSDNATKLRKLWDAEGGNSALFRSAYNLETGRTSARRLTAGSLKDDSPTSKARTRPRGILAEPTDEERRSQQSSQLEALERALADLRARAADGADLSRPIAWQEARIAKYRRDLAS